MTVDELKAKGYRVERDVADAEVVRLFQNDVHVGTLSPLISGRLAFDWHRHDQWHLRSDDIAAMCKE